MRSLFSTRARPNEMTKAQRARLDTIFLKYLVSVGAEQIHEGDCYCRQCKPKGHAFGPAWIVLIDTLAGPLRIRSYGNWLACSFEEPCRALTYVTCGRQGGRLNEYTGKWNWHFARQAPEEALGWFRGELEPLLPERKTP